VARRCLTLDCPEILDGLTMEEMREELDSMRAALASLGLTVEGGWNPCQIGARSAFKMFRTAPIARFAGKASMRSGSIRLTMRELAPSARKRSRIASRRLAGSVA